MKKYLMTGLGIMVLMSTVSLTACNKSENKKSDVKVVKTEKAQVFPEPVTVSSLDKRVSAIEARNARIDTNIRKARAAAASTPKSAQ